MQISYSINTRFVCFIWVFCFVLFSFVLETMFHLELMLALNWYPVASPPSWACTTIPNSHYT